MAGPVGWVPNSATTKASLGRFSSQAMAKAGPALRQYDGDNGSSAGRWTAVPVSAGSAGRQTAPTAMAAPAWWRPVQR